MKTKKFLAAGLAATMVLSLAACGGNTTPPAADGGDDANKTPATDLSVGVLYYNYSDTYIASVRSALDGKLGALGIAFNNQDGAGNQTTQTEQAQNEITRGAGALIVNIVNTGSDDAATGIVDKAKAADLPLIFFNREVSDEVIKSYEKSAFVGTDAPEAGHMQGKMVGEYVRDNFDKLDLNGDGKISYVMFKGEQGNAEAEYRTQFGVEDADAVLTAAGKSALEFYDSKNADKFLVDKNGQWSATASQEYMTTILTEYNATNNNMVELVICNNDGMAEGAVTALNTAGYNKGGDSPMVPVFGVDATDAAKALIKDGKMVGTIKQDADGMAECISTLVANIAGGKDLMDGVAGKYTVDEGVNKIRIPYQVYMGE